MDPLTQGALGAVFVQATTNRTRNLGVAGGLGFLSGMAADLDALIRSSADPLLFLEYHRHFTHSLAFIPVGGLLCALVIQYVLGRRWRLTFLQTFVCCTLGYGTHALLDASTSYGTTLLWPFSDERLSWSIVPIIDPLFTVPLVTLCAATALRQTRVFSWAAMLWVSVYLSIGALQHSAALSMAKQTAESRGHSPIRFVAKPSFANILLWKTVYETSEHFHVDAVRVGLAPRHFDGTVILKLDLERDLPWLDAKSQQAKDIQRFADFSKAFVAEDPEVSNRIFDVRYSFVPNEIKPLWSVEISPAAELDAHAAYRTHRENPRESVARLWKMLCCSGADE